LFPTLSHHTCIPQQLWHLVFIILVNSPIQYPLDQPFKGPLLSLPNSSASPEITMLYLSDCSLPAVEAWDCFPCHQPHPLACQIGLLMWFNFWHYTNLSFLYLSDSIHLLLSTLLMALKFIVPTHQHNTSIQALHIVYWTHPSCISSVLISVMIRSPC